MDLEKVSAKIRPIDSHDLIPLVSVLTLSGSQQILLEFLFEQCIFNNSLITLPITKEQLTTATTVKEETAISSIKRLRQKRLIDRVEYKDGRFGWTRYKMAELTYTEILNFRNSKSPFATEINFQTQSSFAEVSAGIIARTSEIKPTAGWFKQLDADFESWYDKATDVQLLELLIPNEFLTFRSELYKKNLRALFFKRSS